MTWQDLVAPLTDYVRALELSPRDQLAHVAVLVGAALVVAGAFVRTMIPLRWLAVGSNIGFLLYGLLHPSLPTALVAALLLPINLYRVQEMTRLTRRVTAAQAASDVSGVWLRPYMKPMKLAAGQVLFHRGDEADRLYLLVEGRIDLVEIARSIRPGRVFGEIALFSPDRRRTHTARCVTACTVLTIDEDTVQQLYYQNPAFGFHLIRLVAARLSRDVARVEERTLTGLMPLSAPPAADSPPPPANPPPPG